MSTTAIVNFKFGKEVLPMYVRSDDYPSRIVLALTQLKLFCDAQIIKFQT